MPSHPSLVSQEMTLISKQLCRNFAREFFNELRKRHIRGGFFPTKEKTQSGDWIIEGSLASIRDCTVISKLKTFISPRWMIEAPTICVDAPFIKKTVEWHSYNHGCLCYVHPVEWYEEHEKYLEYFKTNPDEAINRSVRWALEGLDNLVHKHFLGWQAGLTEWPDEWLDWEHGDEGIKQYYDEQNARQLQRS